MHSMLRRAAVPGIALSVFASALGQADPEEALDCLVREALAGDPGLAALEELARADRDRVIPAGTLPDPMVEGMFQIARFPSWTVGSDEMSEFGVEVRQGLSPRAKREARRQAAAARALIRDRERESARLELVREIRANYAALFLVDRQLSLLELSAPVLQALEESAGARYAAGDAGMESLLQVRLALSELGERREDLEAGRALAVAALNRLARRPQGTPLGRVEELPAVDFSARQQGPAGIVESAPELARLRAEIAAGQRAVEAERWELRPTYSGAGYAGFRGQYDPVVAVKVGLEWPARRRQKQELQIRAMERENTALGLALAAAENRQAEELERLRIRGRTAESQAQRLDEVALPLTEAAFDAARIAFETGRGDFGAVLLRFQDWFEARVARARREAERFDIWAAWQALGEAPGGAGEQP